MYGSEEPNIAILPNQIYRFHIIAVKIPEDIFWRNLQVDSKILMKM